MKKLFFTLAIAIIGILPMFAQHEQFQSLLKTIEQAFNAKDITKLDGLIGDECSILGNSGALVIPSLKALFGILANDTIKSMALENKEVTPNGNTLFTFSIKYSGIGEKKACFGFDVTGKIIQLDYLMGAKSQIVKKVSAVKAGMPVMSIPFSVDDVNLIVLKGTINGKECNLIWDSGAKRSILNSDYLSKLNLQSGNAYLGGVNSQSASGVAVADSIDLKVLGITTQNASFLAMSLKHLESNPTELPIAGLIGMDIFGEYDIIYDYNSKKLILIDSSVNMRMQGNPLATIPYSRFAADYLPCIKVNIEGKEVELGIDCGAGTNLIHENILPDGIEYERKSLKGISGNTTEQKFGKTTVTIDSVPFENQPFVVGDISHLNLGIDGLLGYPFLCSHKMMLKNSTKELIIF